MMDEEDPDLQNLDVVLYSFVFKDLSVSTIMADHLNMLETVQKQFSPRYLLPNHLVACDWTVDPAALEQAVKQSGLENIVVPKDAQETFDLA